MLILTHGTNLTMTNSFSNVDCSLPLKPTLEDFWKVESIGVMENPEMSNDEMAMKHFKDTLKFYDGRYHVTWPWRQEYPNLPANRDLAYCRLKSTVTKLLRKPELLKMYNSVIEEQHRKGIVEEVDRHATPTGLVHYIPHHAVVTPLKTTTKLRIVYDASARASQSDKSLNENLYRGPVMLHDLCGMLMRFRLHRIALVADIEKAFLQIGIQPCDRDVTRFLWMRDVNKPVTEKGNIIEYRFCRVPFGIISSPFLLGATIESHLDSIGSQIADKIKNDIYVDNLITGSNTIPEAIELYKKAKSIFDDISMNLREWTTNEEKVNMFIQDKDRAKPGVMKVLGHNWDIETDQLSLQPSNHVLDTKLKETKRSVLKNVASVFDPLGLYSPTILKGKLLLQTLWSQNLDWDEEIRDEDYLEWKSIQKDLEEIRKCKIPRCVTSTKHSTENNKYTLTCFCDASAKAYSCCIYLHQDNIAETKAEIIFSKSRLAPVKKLTIPKLEIMAVLIGVRSLCFVKEQLRLDLDICFLWTDSQCVLHWINSKKCHSVFIRNRVAEVNTHKDIQFGFVPSSENPADIATRGASIETLQNNEMWWHGPAWLSLRISEWPKYKICNNPMNEQTLECIDKDEIEIKNFQNQIVTNVCVNSEIYVQPYGIDIEIFSSMTKLLRVSAYVSRFIKNIRGRQSKTFGHITSEELEQAEILWLRYIQKKHFSEAINSIMLQKPSNLQRQLGLFVDELGLLRCRERLGNADLTFGARYPVLLPKCETFTKLLIRKTHEELLHSGVSQTLSKIRYKYWIVRGRATVKSVIKRCIICRRFEGGPYKMPDMPPLPNFRVSESAPFSSTGLDYLGPLFIKTENGHKKIWVCLFTCLLIRAVHLEMVNNMTSEEFLMAFRRFISLRGTPTIMISDNALQFKAANKILDNVLRNAVKSEDVQSYASNAHIKWKFIVELSPWMGGYYERLVGLVKRTLRKTIGRRLLTSIQMQTLLKETEAILNSRPLVYVEEDIDSCMAISPAHFLSLNRNIGLPEMDKTIDIDGEYLPYESSGSTILKLWKKGLRILDSFWRLWRNDYLLSLRERTQSQLKSGKL